MSAINLREVLSSFSNISSPLSPPSDFPNYVTTATFCTCLTALECSVLFFSVMVILYLSAQNGNVRHMTCSHGAALPAIDMSIIDGRRQ